jgi:plasmid stabilization system protein ParE
MKHYRVVLAETAKDNILDIVEYIAADNPSRAGSFTRELTASLRNTLSLFPRSGRVVTDFDFDFELRMFPYENYLSYYRIQEDRKIVEILFIFHGSRDFQSLMKRLGLPELKGPGSNYF